MLICGLLGRDGIPFEFQSPFPSSQAASPHLLMPWTMISVSRNESLLFSGFPGPGAQDVTESGFSNTCLWDVTQLRGQGRARYAVILLVPRREDKACSWEAGTAKQIQEVNGRFLRKNRELHWLLPREFGSEVSGLSQRNLASTPGKLVLIPYRPSHLSALKIGKSPASLSAPCPPTSSLRFNQSPEAPPYF